MLVSTLIAAAVLSQACPQPLSRNGPPPCAAANVPGCLPGYHREVDAYGRVQYVCDAAPRAAPSPPVAAPTPAPTMPPPPPRYVPAPPAYGPAYAAPAATGHRGTIGIVLMPGLSSVPYGYHDSTSAGAIALEVRPDYGGGRLRFSFDSSRYLRAAEVGLKYDFFDWAQVRPFIAIGLGGGVIDPDPTWRLTGSIAGGLDLYLTQNVFFTVELKGRAFAEHSGAVAYGLDPGAQHQTTFFMGLGLYF